MSGGLAKPGTKLTETPGRTIAATEERRCDHCGNRFQPRFEEERFCCSGCRVVHDLIQSGGFGSFYELLGRRVLQPATNLEPAGDQLEEIAEAITEAENGLPAPDSPARLTLRLGNLSCTACVWLVDHLFRQYPGALRMSSDTSRSTLTLWWNPGEFDALGFVRDLHRYGYPASICRPGEEEAPQESRALLTRLGVTAGLAMNTMAFTLPSYLGLETGHELDRLFTLVAFASSSLALAVGGSYFFQRALTSVQLGALHMDVPISLGLIAAWLGSVGGWIFGIKELLYFDFVATFAFLMLSGRYIHLRLLDRNRRQLWAREREITTTHRLGGNGDRERIPLARIGEGDLLEIAPGGMVPVESLLESEPAKFHLDWINGEPEPVLYASGQRIPAGARNASASPLRVVAGHGYGGSFLEQLFTPVDDDFDEHSAASSTHPIRKYYLVSVLLVAFGGAVAWLAAGKGAASALQVLISVLVVSCPCALGLALPLLDEILLAKLRKHGLFIRRHSLWSRLKAVNRLDFDKTGTLTEPVKRLADPEIIDQLDEESLIALRRLTETNHHPVGRALREVIVARRGWDLTDSTPGRISETPGKGVECRDHGFTWRLGRGDWASDRPDEACVFSRDGVAVASFRFEEAIRDGAIDQLRRLRSRGYRLRILSGDPDVARVASTAAKLGIETADVHANLNPAEKAALISADQPDKTLFVGDGGNDGLAFEAAAATGSPATGIRAIENRADFVFTGRGFHAIPLLLDAAARRRNQVTKLFTVALLYNLAAVALCLAGVMSPLLAAILMPLSSLVTTTMAARV
ncbi:MAG: heavy metal translocating P-type ATPase metal-binding domain-containing protein [Verrucomicrobiae bacterium]|nr:heavy metal translocating P-type ATPase metal-binding domain-containing protein [Verrucomicrobiae bacterium]